MKSVYIAAIFVCPLFILQPCVPTLFAADLSAGKLFEPNHVVEVEITVPEADWASLCRQSRRNPFAGSLENPFSYFKADVTIDGVKIANVGIRKKGFIGSLDDFRPSLKVKFDEFVDQAPIDGLANMTLNNNKQDRSLLSQQLTYYVFRKAGVHAPRCNFATVTVNGEYLGIYSHVESIKKPFLKNEFGDSSGKLYEGTLADFYPKAIDRIEAKSKQADKDRDKIKELAELLEAADTTLADIESIVDVENFLRFWVVESIIGFWDGYTQNQNNFFVYESPKNGQLYFMPWGADSCFGDRGFGRFGGQGGVAVRAESILANRLYHMDGIPERYRQIMLTVLDDVWHEKDLLAEISRARKVVYDDISDLQLDALREMNRVSTFVQGRRDAIMAELNSNWPPRLSPEPRIPFHSVAIGKATGFFSTKYNQSGRSSDSLINLSLDGSSVEIADVTVAAGVEDQRFGRRGFGRFGGPQPEAERPIAITLNCGTSDGRNLELSLVVPRSEFGKLNQEPTPVSGSFADGDVGGFGRRRMMMQQLQGTLTLKESGLDDGDTVAGSFEVEITEMRGGPFGGRR